MRKEDLYKACTNVHTDITRPYDSLEFIHSVTQDGEIIPVIKNGRFILKCIEILNEPFKSKA